VPIYEYICQDCETSYERLVRSSSERIECPKCGSGRKQMKFSSPNGAASAGSETSSAAGSCACTPRGCGCH
jgi:putative FmdB family regulatory protein